MKRGFPLSVLLAAGSLLVGSVRAQSVDFDTPNDLANKFTIRPGSSGTFYSQTSTGGITGGAVDVFATLDNTDSVFLKSSTPIAGEVTLTTSLFFRYDSTLRDSTTYRFPIALGFARTPYTGGYNSSSTMGIDAGVYLETYNDTTDREFPVLFGLGETHAGSIGTLVSGHWYRLTLNLQPVGGTGRAVLSVALVDFGSAGQVPQLYFPVFTQNVFAFSGNAPTELYPAFRAFKSGGVDLLDNFSVSTGGTLPNPSRLGNISTRGRVNAGENALIGGIIVQGETPKRIIVRAIGPSLSQFGVAGVLPDPVLTLFDASGQIIAQNDSWRSTQQQEIIDTKVPPTDDLESAIVISLSPANYTAVVTGANGATGVALVEVYDLQ